MDTVWITGATGFVGGRLVREWTGRYRLLTPPRAELDLMDLAAAEDYVLRRGLRLIVHTAAFSNTGWCQQHPEESAQLNRDLPAVLAGAARKTGAKLVFFSSDQVYGGTAQAGPLPETAPLAPVNVYGLHKWQAEQAVLEQNPDAVCLRATWMYDLPCRGLKNNLGLPGLLYRAALTGQPLERSSAEYRGVTWVGQVTEHLEAIAALPGGVYNMGAENVRDSLETCRLLMERMGLGERAQELVRPAVQPARNLSMDTDRLKRYGICFGDTVHSLEECLRAYGLPAGNP